MNKLSNGILIYLLIINIFPGITLGKYKYNLAITAIFQNEARFMAEWIEFHKLAGVEHFYLYNNYSTDNYKQVLRPYILAREVELFDWKLPFSKKLLAHDDAIKRSLGVAKWLAILDLDEFLFPVKEHDLRVLLNDYEQYGGVCANWVLYGTSYVKKIPGTGLMTEYLTFCNPEGNQHIKSIIRPERVLNYAHHHFAKYKEGYFSVNSDKEKIEGPFSKILLDKVRINHYFTRDEDYLYNVKLPREEKINAKYWASSLWGVPIELARKMTTREWLQAINKVATVQEDKSIYKYLPQLKQNMAKYLKQQIHRQSYEIAHRDI